MHARTMARTWGWLYIRILTWHRGESAAPARSHVAFDEFDRRMRLSIVLAFFGGSLIHLLVTLLAPDNVCGSTIRMAIRLGTRC